MRFEVGAILIMAAALGCSHGAPPPSTAPAPQSPEAALGEPFEVHAGESRKIRGEPVTLVFEQILSDNRCAVDVQCITAGEARGSFRLEKAGALSVSFRLDTGKNGEVTVNGYTIRLRSISPAPRSTVRIDPGQYVAEMVVSR